MCMGPGWEWAGNSWFALLLVNRCPVWIPRKNVNVGNATDLCVWGLGLWVSIFCIRDFGNGILSRYLVNLNDRVIAIAQEFFRDKQKEINKTIGVFRDRSYKPLRSVNPMFIFHSRKGEMWEYFILWSFVCRVYPSKKLIIRWKLVRKSAFRNFVWTDGHSLTNKLLVRLITENKFTKQRAIQFS